MQLNPSSLLDLKAELSKKYESFKKAKLKQNSEPVKRTFLKNKGATVPKEKKSHSLTLNNDSSEEELALQKSRLALEAKAKLYDQITSDKILIDDEHKDLYLVDFDRKVLYESKINSAPQITDQTDLNVNSTVNSNTPNKHDHVSFDIKSNKLSTESVGINSTRSDLESDSVHYQDILHNEIRDHGTAYFAFSTDEAKRKEQMEELNLLRKETEDHRQMKQKLQKKRATALQARLAKVCERRNINQSVIEEFTKHEVENPDETTGPNIDLETIPLPEAAKVEETEKKVPKVRPWDIGKTEYTLNTPRKRTKTQHEWEEERRSERPSEFAPPSFYGN